MDFGCCWHFVEWLPVFPCVWIYVSFWVLCFLFYLDILLLVYFQLDFLSMSCFLPLCLCAPVPNVFHLCPMSSASPVCISVCASLCVSSLSSSHITAFPHIRVRHGLLLSCVLSMFSSLLSPWCFLWFFSWAFLSQFLVFQCFFCLCIFECTCCFNSDNTDVALNLNMN